MAKKQPTYITTRDIVIPAGTVVHHGFYVALQSERIIEIDMAITKDSTATWTMPFDKALENELIKEQPS